MLRYYADGFQQTDRLQLFNLSEDIGETKNLVNEQPERAAAMNAAISVHLADTAALVPQANPAYQPCVLGWTGNKYATISRGEGVLHAECTGNDPWISTAAFPSVSGDVTVEIRMRSTGSGDGAVYFATQDDPTNHRKRMTTFLIDHDSQWHTYLVNINLESRLKHLRVDIGQAEGTVDIQHIRLMQWSAPGAGKVPRHWAF